MHRAGGLVFFDYASAAPYVKIDMNPIVVGADAPFAHMDGLFFSGHKFLGGCGCPGVLIVKKNLLPSLETHPTQPGGGTVFYVSDLHHRYTSNQEEREEGGTPNIVGDIRLGLVVHLKNVIGSEVIEREEIRIGVYVQERLLQYPRIVVLGSQFNVLVDRKLPIFSFLIRHGNRFLHHSFVCALLNDLFGIQSRGGCLCAGPFGHMLLGVTQKSNEGIENAIEKDDIFRPGYTRLSFPYWISKAEVDFVIEAIKIISEHGWKFLPMYRFNQQTYVWADTSELNKFSVRKWLSKAELLSDPVTNVNEIKSYCLSNADQASYFQKVLADVKLEVEKMEKLLIARKEDKSTRSFKDDFSGFDDIRWFVTGDEVELIEEDVSKDLSHNKICGPLNPWRYRSIFSPTDPLNEDSINLDPSSETTDVEWVAKTTTSSYVWKRNEKVKERSGDKVLPKYLSIEVGQSLHANVSSSQEFNSIAEKSKIFSPIVSSDSFCGTGSCVIA